MPARPVIVVEDDPFLRLVGVVLDPGTSPERIAAFADFFAHDMPDFAGWLARVRANASAIWPAQVRLVTSDEAFRENLAHADAVVIEGYSLGAENWPRRRV